MDGEKEIRERESNGCVRDPGCVRDDLGGAAALGKRESRRKREALAEARVGMAAHAQAGGARSDAPACPLRHRAKASLRPMGARPWPGSLPEIPVPDRFAAPPPRFGFGIASG